MFVTQFEGIPLAPLVQNDAAEFFVKVQSALFGAFFNQSLVAFVAVVVARQVMLRRLLQDSNIWL